MADERPNIILILCDQMRADWIGVGGNSWIETPNLDYLTAQGTRFAHAYSPVPSCLPARASLWSGQNQWHTGVLGMGCGQGPIPNDFPHTLAGELTSAGYRTHLVGKGHFHPQRASMGFETSELDESGRTLIHGFRDEYRTWFHDNAPAGVSPDDHGVDWNSWLARPWHTAEYLHPTAWTMSRALAFLAARGRARPFFLNISFARPHSPYVPPQPYFDLYAGRDMPMPHVGDWEMVREDPLGAPDPNAWRGRLSPDRIRRARIGYSGEITFIDAQVGRLLNWLGRFERDALASTWIVFTSDHGDMQGDHHLWRKTYAYEGGSSRVPFFIVPPRRLGRPARRIADEPVVLHDIMPTLLETAGVAVPGTVDGRSLLPLLEGPAAEWRTHVHGEHCTCYAPEQEMQFVTDGRRKFIWLPRLGREQFFDLEADPGECHDLIAEAGRQDEVARWRSLLVQELAARDCGWVRGGTLHCPSDEPLVSPYRDVRWGKP